jgi:DNA-binding Lrp family transcriptional regulator
MVRGYLLIKLVPGLEVDALPQIRAVPGVLEVNLVFGHWDSIAITEANTLFELSRLVINQIRGIQGVQDTETLLQGET